MNISESVQAILSNEDLLSGKFYERFFAECPHMSHFFKGVDMQRQSSMLTSALVLVETTQSKNGAGLSPFLRLLGRQHEQRGISKGDFGDWTESMIRTLSDYHGEDWTDSLEHEWRGAIRASIDVMLEGYLKHEDDGDDKSDDS